MIKINIRLVDRDKIILEQVTKWRFLLGRQIKVLADFQGQRACDRRLSKLIESGYLVRKYVLYGISGLYLATEQAKKAFELEFITKSIRIENIRHDIAVIDTAIYFINQRKIDKNAIKSEREFKHDDFKVKSRTPHRPDFIFEFENKTYCVEVELSVKKKETLEKNVKDNYFNYDNQIWIIPSTQLKILENLKNIKYPTHIINFEEVTEYVKTQK